MTRERPGRIRSAAEGARGTAVVLSANPLHDTGGGQRSAQLALELVERGWAVVFVSHGRVTETLDLRLRYDHARLVELSLTDAVETEVTEALMSALAERGGMVITQVPVRAWLPVLEGADERGVETVYDCIDRWDSELGRGWYERSVEAEVAAASSVLTASAPALVDHVETLTGRETALLPNAFNARIFDPVRSDGLERPADLPVGRRIALYVGALWGGWMDWDLARRTATALPDTDFVFVGDHRGEGRRLPENCRFAGLKPQTDLPAWLAHADVAFLPWRAGEVTEATSPLKVYEFVAMGLPVVAPDIEPLRGIPGVRVAADAEAFVGSLAELDRDSLPPRERDEMRRFSEASSWKERVDRLLELTAGVRPRAGPEPERAAGATADSPAGATRPGRADRSPSSRRTRTAPRGATLSVVIPAFNHERYVGEAIDSVVRQTLPAAELVVVDDGSSDRTAAVVADRELPGLRLVRQVNRGAHHALNRAIRLSRGEWVAILNSDDAFEPERLEHAWSVARATGAALVLGSVRLVDEHGGPVDPSHEIAKWYRDVRVWASAVGSLPAVLRRHNVAVTTSNFFMHRELWARLGGFRGYRYVHDYDFLLRAMELCPDRIVWETSVEDVRYRVHGVNTITETGGRADEERREMLRSLARPLRRVRRLVRSRRDARAVRARVDGCDSLAPTADLARPVPGSAGTRSAPGGRLAEAVQGATVRVGLVVESLGTGGLEEVVALLAQSLPTVGLDACVACGHEGGPVADRLVRAGVDVEVLGGDFDRVAAWARGNGLRAVSSHFAPVDLVVALERDGVPVVETVQNSYAWLTEAGWERERERVASVRGVIAVSETAAGYFRERTGHAPEWIVPNAVQPGRAARAPRPFARRRLGIGTDAPVLVFVGRITEQKNPRGLVDAFALVAERVPDAVLVLAGPADGSASIGFLRRRHRSLFSRGAVRHVASPRHVGSVLSAADAFVSNSFYEGWSVAASEAAWVGLPLVLSDVGGSGELVGSGSTRGIVVPNPCGDPLSVTQSAIAAPSPDKRHLNQKALADALIDVATRIDLWRERSGDIRDWARSRLSPEAMASRYAEILVGVSRDAPG